MQDNNPPEPKSTTGPISRRMFVGLALGTLTEWLAACGRPLPAPSAAPTSVARAAASATTTSPSSAPIPAPSATPMPTSSSPTTAPATPAPSPLPTAASVAVPDRATLMAHWPVAGASRVVVVRHSQVWAGDAPDPALVLRMLDAGMSTLAGTPDVMGVWRALFDPGEQVLLKVNCISAGGPTQPVVAYAVAQRLQDAGVRAEQILIFDRTDDELAAAGYALNESAPGVRCHGARGTGTRLALSQAKVHLWQELDACDAIVNVPTPKQHDMAGISVSMKNHYGSVDDPGRLHGRRCDPAIAELNAQPPIAGKTRLIVAAALKVSPDDWDRPERENALLLSFDPVALDTVARDILVRHRKTMGMDSGLLMDGAAQLRTAQKLGLGTADAGKIDLRELDLG